MKFMHLADLHFGKRLHDMSLIEDQEYIMKKIVEAAEKEKIDAVLIAGDIYDTSIAPVNALDIFEDFLIRMAEKKIRVFAAGGNHDSLERLSFGNRFFEASDIHIASAYKEAVKPVKLSDEYGDLYIYMLPFVKPATVKHVHEDEEISSYTDAVRCAISKMEVSTDERNVLIAHQFVTGGERSESEDVSVGGSDNVDASVFDCFDYTALGHLHNPQSVGKSTIRYSGSPLKYSFSEAPHSKSITIVDVKEKGTVEITEIPLVPLRDVVEIKGLYMDLTAPGAYSGKSVEEDYVHITLLDEDEIPDAMSKLRLCYRNLLKLDYDNKRTRARSNVSSIKEIEEKTPEELVSQFYKEQNGQELSDVQLEYLKEQIEKIWKD